MPPFNFFHDIYEYYQTNRFCDLTLCGSLATPKDKPILVHKLVLCSLFHEWPSFIQEETDHVTLPDFQHVRLKQFVDQIYGGLIQEVHSWKDLDPEIADFFKIHQPFTLKSPEKTLNQLLSPEIELTTSKSEDERDIPDFLEPNAIDIFREINADDQEDSDQEDGVVDDDEEDWKHGIDDEDIALSYDNFEPAECKRTSASKAKKRTASRPSTKRDRHVKRKTVQTPLPTTTGPEIDHTGIIDLLQNQGQGTLPVHVTSSPITSFKGARYDKRVCNEGCLFLALIGVKFKTVGEICGKSLAWSTDDPEVIGRSFSPALLACHEVFGLPRAHLLGSGCFRTFVETGKQSKNPNYVNDLHRKFMYQCTRENLLEEQSHPEVVAANTTIKPTRKEVDLPSTNYSITMTDDLRHFDDVLLVGVYKRQVEIRQISFNNSRPEFQVSTCCRLLTLVWVGGDLKAKFPRSQVVTEINKENTRLRYTKTFTEKLLASNEILPKPLPVLTCEFCGKQIQENMFMNNMLQHMQVHKLQKFECKCNLKFESLEEKQRHCEETHGELFRKQKKPKRQVHLKHICEICGKVICSKQYLKLHVLRSHQKYFCQHCEKYFDSATVFETHWTQVHPGMEMQPTQGEYSCDQCPKRFRHKLYLQRHWTLNHGTTKKDQPHKCGLCQKTFSEKLKLSQHVLCIHINNRPYVCRSSGCPSSFNSQGNLYAHEKKHHGRVMGKVTPLNTLVPDSLLVEMGCELGKTPPGRPKRRLQW